LVSAVNLVFLFAAVYRGVFLFETAFMMWFIQGLVLLGTIELRPCLLPPISSPGESGEEIPELRHCAAIGPALAAEQLIGLGGLIRTHHG